MQLAPMRYTTIKGTAVGVKVTSAREAKAAIKELRHKKRELKFVRGALVRRQKAARGRGRQGKAEMSGFGLFLDDMRWALSSLMLRHTQKQPERTMSSADIERELRSTDEILHNIDGCILQLEGKLLTLK
jgi:hypothetical protein